MDVEFWRGIQLSRRNFRSRIVTLKPSIAIRTLEPELLDELPPDDPRAIASRRDLQRLNRWLSHDKLFQRALRNAGNPRRVLEIGCGDGTFALRVLRKFPAGEITLIDRQAMISTETLSEFAKLGWNAQFVKADIFDWLPKQNAVDCIMANLFLHHFESEKLRELLRLIAERTNVFIACEPRRSTAALLGAAALLSLTCSAVTRYDGAISIRAGFRDHELSSTWPAANWDFVEKSAGIGNHLFVATKRA